MSEVFDPNNVLPPITGAPAVNPVVQFAQAQVPAPQWQPPQQGGVPQQWSAPPQQQYQQYQQQPQQQYQQGGFSRFNQPQEPPHLFFYGENTKNGAPMLRGTITEEGKRFLASNLNGNLKIAVYYTKQGKAAAVGKFYIGKSKDGGGYNNFSGNQFVPPNNAPF